MFCRTVSEEIFELFHKSLARRDVRVYISPMKQTIRFESSASICDSDAAALGEMFADLVGCAHVGECYDTCKAFVEKYDITGNEDDCRAYLLDQGAWTKADLRDHDENLIKVVWCYAHDLRENGEAFFG